jgi:hypothetical protein
MPSTPSILEPKVYRPSVQAARCMQSDRTFRLLIGPRGEGKTACALMTLYTHAVAQGPARWPLILACVRDTRANIGITTAPSIKEWWPPGLLSSWVGKETAPEHAKIRGPEGREVIEAHFFGCDSMQDLNRFQSFQCDMVLIEDCLLYTSPSPRD